MEIVLVAPILIALASGALTIVLKRYRRAQRWLSVTSTIVQVLMAGILLMKVQEHGILAFQAGSWAAPLGITIVADMMSAIMVLVASIMALIISVYSMADINSARERYGYHPLFHILMMGVYGTFLTGDLFNLYVWFEVMLIASFVLLVLGNTRKQLDGTTKYVVINLVSSLILLAGVSLIYGMTGTLNMAELSSVLDDRNAGLVTSVSVLFLLSFGVKSALFPLFFWLPASYHTPPVSVTALFGGLLTKVGIYIMIRTFTLLFTPDPGTAYLRTLLLWGAGFTMVTGVLGAVAQTEIRRLLSFHIISQIGYMVMGLGLAVGTEEPGIAVMAALFYVVHNIFAKSNLFLISGVMKRVSGSFHLESIGGLYRNHTYLAILFLISAFALAGFPPLSGFWAKFYVIYAGLQAEQFVLVGIALGVGVLTLYSMTKIWKMAYWSPEEETERTNDEPVETLNRSDYLCLVTPIVLLCMIIVVLGIFPDPFYQIFETAQEHVMNADLYREAVNAGEVINE